MHPKDPRYTHLHGKNLVHPFNGRKIPIVCDDILVSQSLIQSLSQLVDCGGRGCGH